MKNLFLLFFLSIFLTFAGTSDINGQCTIDPVINGSFEYGQASGTWSIRPGGSWIGVTYGEIEIWGTPFLSVNAIAGTNLLEVNSYGLETVYQDVSTTTGATYNWAVWHHGRSTTNTARIEFGPPGGPYQSTTMTTGTSWAQYNGSYTATSTTTQIRLVGVTGTCGNSCGNLIDALTFSTTDSDCDGVPDDVDNCPTVSNPLQANYDGDSQGDACDPDDDNDGVLDGNDSDPLNEFACSDTDGDGCDDCSSGTYDLANDGPDNDGDGLCNTGDNCPDAYNPGQIDTDCDGVGDVCDQWDGCDDDLDMDGDGIPACIDVDDPGNNRWICNHNENKITVCHIPAGNPANRHDICISKNAVQTHLDEHGDYIGECGYTYTDCGMRPFGNNEGPEVINSGYTDEIQLEVFPNPAAGKVNVNLFGLNSEATLTVFDQLGRVIMSQDLHENQEMTRLDFSSDKYQNGIYLISVTTENERLSSRLVITK